MQRLSVFAGGWALDAAEAVCAATTSRRRRAGSAGPPGRQVAGGVRWQDGRYRLLETVRQYALERLAASGEEARTRDAHLAFFVALSQHAGAEIIGPKQDAWHRRLDAERENVLLAFAQARRAPGGGAAGLALLHGLNMWITLRDFEFWRRVALEALAHPDAQQEDVMRSRALCHTAFIAFVTGRHEEAFALAQSSVRIARACGDLLALGVALHHLGTAAIAVGREADAREHFVEGLAAARQAGDSRLAADTLSGMGELCAHQGQFDLAERHYLDALPGYRGDPVNAGIALTNLARNAIARRLEAKAVHYLRKVAAISARKYTVPVAVFFLSNCAGLASLREEWTLALRLCGAADSTGRQHGLTDDFVDARFHAERMARAREALGTEAAATALAGGRALDIDTVLREAEAWLAALPSDESPP